MNYVSDLEMTSRAKHLVQLALSKEESTLRFEIYDTEQEIEIGGKIQSYLECSKIFMQCESK